MTYSPLLPIMKIEISYSEGMESNMRLFIAINLTSEIKRILKKTQDSWRVYGIQGNYTPEENLHITLAFIGDYPDPDHILDVIETVQTKPFTITIDGFGNFDDLWWAGVQPSAELNKTASGLRRALADNQIPFDRKGFTPHITLVRKALLLKEIPPVSIKPVTMTVNHISLMRSDRGKKQMIYKEIGSVEL